jgi:DNA-binding NarL/FixJ family response regulator
MVINRDTWYGTLQKLNGALQLTGCHLIWRMTVTKYILLVDDSELIRSATRHFLESQTGFKVCGEAVDGIDALEKASHLHPDLIILDIAIPRMNGLQTARELRARMHRMPIILFTWYADAVQPEDIEEAGINAVISKTNPSALQSHVNSLLAAA